MGAVRPVRGGSVMTLTPEQLAQIEADGRELCRRTRREQGLPPHVTDEKVLEQIAVLLRANDPERESA